MVALAIIAISSVSAVGLGGVAPDLGSVFGGDSDGNSVTLDGVKFNIPDGFEEVPSFAEDGTVDDYSTFTATAYERGYSSGSNYINVRVVEYDGISVDDDLTNYMDGDSETINGVDGFMSDEYGYTFTYKDGNKVVTIQTDDESLIQDVLA